MLLNEKKGEGGMPYINCRLKAINEKGRYKIELCDMKKAQLLKAIADKDIDGTIARAMSKVFSLFQVNVFRIEYYPGSNYYHWILGDGCVVHKPAQLREARLTHYRQMVLRDFLRGQAFVEEA